VDLVQILFLFLVGAIGIVINEIVPQVIIQTMDTPVSEKFKELFAIETSEVMLIVVCTLF
jgi:hypothetical protein